MLDKTRFIKVRDFRGKILVDIREFYEKNGELLPGKKGNDYLYSNLICIYMLN